MTPSSSATRMHRAGASLGPSAGTVARGAIDQAKDFIGKGDAASAIRTLAHKAKGDLPAFHHDVLALLDSCPGNRETLVEEALGQHPHFQLSMYNKSGKTALDLAVHHDDQPFARFLLDKGAKPERTFLAPRSDGMRALLHSWRRKNLLYSHFKEGNEHSLAPLDRLLREGRHDEVRARVQGMLAGHGVRKTWETAMHAGQRDVLRALLVVGTPDELRELTRQKEQVGKWREALKDDRGLCAALREFSKPLSGLTIRRLLPAFLSRETDPAARNKRYVKAAYQDLRFFHGTNKVNAENIRAKGMGVGLKREGGAMDVTRTNGNYSTATIEHSARNNYFTKSRMAANFYAHTVSRADLRTYKAKEGSLGVPEMVRLFKTSDFPAFEHDSAGPSYIASYRTPEDVPAHAVRQEKGAERYSKEILYALQERIDSKFSAFLSLDDIEKALVDDGAESDSDDEFR